MTHFSLSLSSHSAANLNRLPRIAIRTVFVRLGCPLSTRTRQIERGGGGREREEEKIAIDRKSVPFFAVPSLRLNASSAERMSQEKKRERERAGRRARSPARVSLGRGDLGFGIRRQVEHTTEARSNRTAELFRTVDTSHVVVRRAAVSRTTTPYPPCLYHPGRGVQPPSSWPPFCPPTASQPSTVLPCPPSPFANHRAYHSTSSPA